eukprot:5128338-Prorocentrum_lima.AAC.1
MTHRRERHVARVLRPRPAGNGRSHLTAVRGQRTRRGGLGRTGGGLHGSGPETHHVHRPKRSSP